jgi:trimethylamine--corrinoid protein Co-methyltransferase
MLHTWAKGLEISTSLSPWSPLRRFRRVGITLGTAHTMRHFRTAFYRAELFDYTSSEVLVEAGSADAYMRRTSVKQLLNPMRGLHSIRQKMRR